MYLQQQPTKKNLDLNTILNTINNPPQNAPVSYGNGSYYPQQPQTFQQQPLQNQPQPSLFLVPPQNQMNLMSKASNESINHPYSFGPALLNNTQASQSLFLQNYIKPQDANKNYQNSLQSYQTLMQPFAQQQQPPQQPKTCRVFPPLLVRYMDRGTDQYIPVKILTGGEMKYTSEVPDLVLNFHSDTQAITITVCTIDPKKYKDYELTIWALYSMVSDNMLDVSKFTLLYDQTRYKLFQYIAKV
jgi:hypothetical protein